MRSSSSAAVVEDAERRAIVRHPAARSRRVGEAARLGEERVERARRAPNVAAQQSRFICPWRTVPGEPIACASAMPPRSRRAPRPSRRRS